ncbi:hypothetical protein [Nocardia brasiliensis]|uniref:hypothetical protein n=1 Tax=Nocardia brasiliensis TaxID=37326 RepID=UPI0024547600|nr:hypothetical protein [Nocardia brasiliensis]
MLNTLPGARRADVVAELPAAAAQPGFRDPAAADRLNVETVQKWAAPYLRNAQRRGEIPELGSPQWAALPNGDPRKTGAVVEAALRYVSQASATESAAPAPRVQNATATATAARSNNGRPTFAELQEARRGEQALRAASGPLTPTTAATAAAAGAPLTPVTAANTNTAPRRTPGRGH